jgi:hypothetical protein
MLAFGTILGPVHNQYRETLVSAEGCGSFVQEQVPPNQILVHLMPLMAHTAAGECQCVSFIRP